LAGDALGGHVVGGADKGVCVAAGAKFAGDAEVAEFDGAGAAEEDVGGFDVLRTGQGVSLRRERGAGGIKRKGKESQSRGESCGKMFNIPLWMILQL